MIRSCSSSAENILVISHSVLGKSPSPYNRFLYLFFFAHLEIFIFKKPIYLIEG